MLTGLPEDFSDYALDPIDLGRSGARVYRLTAPNKPTLFLKTSGGRYGSHLRDAAARLEWLSGKLPVTEVVHFGEDEESARLLTTAVPGLDLTAFNGESTEVRRRMTVELARALRTFHEVDAYDCPFDHSAARELARLEEALQTREVELGHGLFEAREKLADLRDQQPEETLVLTHGDACLPNIMIENDTLSGFIDLGAMGLSDRCRDLERACWSLGYNYGDGYDEVFLEAYGATNEDRAKLDFYRALEWFTLDDNG